MNANRLFVSLFAVAGFAIGGCAAETSDVSGDDSENASAAATPDDATYYAFTRQDFNRCAAPWCGGIYVKAVNADLRTGRHAGKTRCADGAWRDECYVSEVTYNTFGANGRAQFAFDARFKSGKAFIRGELKSFSNGQGTRPYGKLIANEAWSARTDAAATGDVASLTIPDVVCLSLACPRAFRDLVNHASGGPVGVQKIEFAPGFTQADKDEANEQGQKAGRGLLTAGTVRTVGAIKTHRISQFYTRVDSSFGGEGAACGSRGLSECAPDLFCAFPADSQCGALDGGGTCAKRPEVCTFQYDPVCGCDGKTYGNACSAASAGMSVARKGECEPPKAQIGEACGGDMLGGSTKCDDGLFCDYTLEEICGFADAVGHCKEIPTICTREYMPVCGCNGKKYSNACGANAAGTAVAGKPNANGACN